MNSDINIVDSSGWLEYIAQTPRARFFSSVIEDTKHLLIPTIVLYEVFKKVLNDRGEKIALQVVARMYLASIVDMNSTIALSGARASLQYKLPMADSLIYATARQYEALLWTQDADMEALPGVRYFKKT